MAFGGSRVILVSIMHSTPDNRRLMPSSMRRISKLLLAGPLVAALLVGCSLLPEKIDETQGWSVQQLYSEAKDSMSSGNYKTAIHFRFRDGSEWENAFEYDWRFWNLCELRDLLFEAGFGEVRPYFEGTDEDDDEDGNGVFEYDEVGENCEAWLGYLISLKGPRSNEIGKR